MAAEPLNPLRGILLKIISVMIFVAMQACIKAAGAGVPPGQTTFFRSAFALVPIVIWLIWIGRFSGAFRTARISGHLQRGVIGLASMGFGFYGLVHLPLPEAIAIGYASPLMAVIFAALMLGERVKTYRWIAVLVGLVGVMIVSWPKLTLTANGGLGSGEALGAAMVLLSAALAGLAMVHVRQLVLTESTATIVLYFSLASAVLSLASVPFGWVWLTPQQAALLIGAGICGGVAQIFLTESYRHADVSTVAPFEYVSLILGIFVALVLFGDMPTSATLVGAGITIVSGIYIVWRESRPARRRRKAARAEKAARLAATASAAPASAATPDLTPAADLRENG